jgi:hypothetical protein
MTKEELRDFLKGNNLLHEDPDENRHPAERHWPNGDLPNDSNSHTSFPIQINEEC